MTTIAVAKTSTTNFEFTGYGADEAEAVNALRKTFQAHIKRTGGWLKWSDVKDEVFVQVVA